ncbi:hypothetical protein KJ951_01330, partial [Patescibacteria group bacterium]|nr:hypothetical protein [Patescibacteria group bacterium]MBU1703022.1 hypothetical protein [Patescibacteria group bacterium]
MHNSNDINNETPSMSPREVADKIRRHVMGCSEAARNGTALLDVLDEPFSLNDYLAACKAFLPVKEILPEALLKDRIERMRAEADFEKYFPAGMNCMVAVVPVSLYGMPLDKESLERGDFQTVLVVDGEGRTISGFNIAPSYLHKLMPATLQEACTFKISQDRDATIAAFEKAFRNAQEIF